MVKIVKIKVEIDIYLLSLINKFLSSLPLNLTPVEHISVQSIVTKISL